VAGARQQYLRQPESKLGDRIMGVVLILSAVIGIVMVAFSLLRLVRPLNQEAYTFIVIWCVGAILAARHLLRR
jgi:hypothetical protein